MPPVIVSAKAAAIIVSGVLACFNYLKKPGVGFQPGWESCTQLIAFENNMETQEQADAKARAEATDRAALDAANRIVKAGGTIP